MIKYYAGNYFSYSFLSNEQEYKNYPYWNISYYNENGQLHRLDRPAKEYWDGSKFWYKNDLLHREGGPALEYSNGYKKYIYNGEYIHVSTDKEFKQYLKMKVFI